MRSIALVSSAWKRASSSSSNSSHTATIFAPATGRSKSAIAILRISGPEALKVWFEMTQPPASASASSPASSSSLAKGKSRAESAELRQPPVARRATLRKIVDPMTGETLDEGIVLYFPPQTSLTSQPTLELHTHGSPALMNLLLKRLSSLSPSFRIAEPGEFTRLAFEAGKMDLTQVEGIRDLVESDTETQRKLAARQAGGQMSRRFNEMRSKIIEASALIEALIDFGEDEGISEEVFEQARVKVHALQLLIKGYLDDGRRGEIIRNGIQMAIIGAPNAGKSSLLNWFAQRDAAIVASTPGTTRDVIELSLDFHGFAILLADTAGLRSTQDEVEAIGVQRAQRRAEAADIKICLLSIVDLFALPSSSNPSSSLTATIDPLTLSLIDATTMIVLNKSDAFELTSNHRAAVEGCLLSHGKSWYTAPDGNGQAFLDISVRDGTGMQTLTEQLKVALQSRFDLSDDVEDTPIVTSARHRRHLEECRDSLAVFSAMDAEDIVLAAEELRYAVLSLGRITGAVDVEEILGEIFSGFCVGK